MKLYLNAFSALAKNQQQDKIFFRLPQESCHLQPENRHLPRLSGLRLPEL